jgi:ribulose-phosphate 3-epimerase
VSDRISATGRRIALEVDGGVRPENVGALVRAGADVLVACPALFGPGDCAAAVAALEARPVKRPPAMAVGGAA